MGLHLLFLLDGIFVELGSANDGQSPTKPM